MWSGEMFSIDLPHARKMLLTIELNNTEINCRDWSLSELLRRETK